MLDQSQQSFLMHLSWMQILEDELWPPQKSHLKLENIQAIPWLHTLLRSTSIAALPKIFDRGRLSAEGKTQGQTGTWILTLNGFQGQLLPTLSTSSFRCPSSKASLTWDKNSFRLEPSLRCKDENSGFALTLAKQNLPEPWSLHLEAPPPLRQLLAPTLNAWACPFVRTPKAIQWIWKDRNFVCVPSF
jgi:hypothetical protein